MLPSIAKRRVYELEREFGDLVNAFKKQLLHDTQKMLKLPDVLEFQLPQRLEGLRDFIKCKPFEEEEFSDFFRQLEYMWDILDYDLLNCLIMAYDIEELIEQLESYEEKIEKFCDEITISELIKYWKPRFTEETIPKEIKECVTELQIDPYTCKVSQLKDIQMELRKSLPRELAKAAFYICNIKHSSVKVVWWISANCKSEIVDKFRKLFQSNPQFITCNKISVFSVDDVVLYSSYNDKVRIISY